MDVFDLVATLSLDSSKYENGLNAAEGNMKSLGSKLSTAAKVGTAAVGVMAAGVTAASVGFVKAAGDAASYGDAIDKTSQKLGISAEAYQEWDAVLQHSGTSIESMSATFKRLANASQDATDDQVAAFERLGLSMDKVSSMSAEDLFSAVIERLQGMEEGTERTALATELLGRGAMEMGALLNTSAEDTRAMRERVHELGGVMSDEAVKAAAAYQDSLQDMQTAFSGLSRGLVSEFLPSITSAMNGITDLFTGNQEGGLAKISDGIDGIVDGIAEKLPDIVEAGVSIIEAFSQAVLENIPKIMESGTQMLIGLMQGFISNLPIVLEAGVQSVVAISSGIQDALPELIPAAVDAILTFAEGLLDNMPAIVDAAIQLMVGLAVGFIDAIPRIIERLPQIITAIVKALIDAIPKIAEAGVQLLSSIVKNIPEIIVNIGLAIPQILSGIANAILEGIPDMIEVGENLLSSLGQGILNGIGGVVERARQAAANILDSIKGFFGIASPSKVFMSIGDFLMQGLSEGILDGLSEVENAMDDVEYALAIDDGGGYDDEIVTTTTTNSVDDNLPELIPTGGSEPEREVVVILELDGIEVGRTLAPYVNRENARIGARLSAEGGF